MHRCGTDVKPSWKSLGVITFISRDYSFSEDWPVAPLEIDGEQHDHLTSRRLYLLRALLAKFFGVRHPLPRVYVEIAQDKAALDLRNNNGPLQLPLTVQIVRIKPQQVSLNTRKKKEYINNLTIPLFHIFRNEVVHFLIFMQVAGEVVPLLHAAVGDLVSAAVALAAEEGGYLSAGETSGEVVNVAELSESPAMGYPTTYPMYVRISSDPPRPVNGFVKGVVVPRFWVDEVMYMAPMHYAQAQGHIARGRSKYSLP